MLCGDFMKKYIEKYISENLNKIYTFLAFLLIGLVVGLLVYNLTSNEVKQELNTTIKDTLELTKQENFEGINVIKNGVISNIIICALIYFSALTLLTPYIVSIINFLKGFTIGIYIPTVFAVFGIGKGILAFILLVLLPNIIYLPAFIYLSINSVNIHNEMIKDGNDKNKMGTILKEGIFLIITFSIMSLATVIEQLTSMGVINIYKGIK